MSSLSVLNPKAETAKAQHALAINMSGSNGLYEVMKTNLGPKGTLKMLVSGSGDLKITKDGCVLLNEMQIQHPTANVLAKCATAQDEITGDGTSSIILYIAELIRQAEIHLKEGLHPRVIVDGFEAAKHHAMSVLDKMTVPCGINDNDILYGIARTSLGTKVCGDIVNLLTEHVVAAVQFIYKEDEDLDLKRIEIVEIRNKTDMDTQLVKGLVLDHGGRHPDMPKQMKNAFILICNVSLEYEKTESNSAFFYKSASERENLVLAERGFIDERVKKIIALKKRVCIATNKDADGNMPGFVLINQKGIDPFSLDALAKEKIIGLRRAKRRNMERLMLACGGSPLNSFESMKEDDLGRAGFVYEYVLGEEKFTFVEECKNPGSVTILLKGPNKHTLTQMKDAINDGTKAVANAIRDKCVVPGAGAFEILAHRSLSKNENIVQGRSRYGVQAFAEALLVIPKVLCLNSGHDRQDAIVRLQEEARTMELCNPNATSFGEHAVGIDVSTGEPFVPSVSGVWDNYIVKKSIIHGSCEMASQLLLVDEIMRAGLESLKG